MEPIWILSGVHQEFTRSPYTLSGVHQESIRSIRTPDGLHKDAWGSVTYSSFVSWSRSMRWQIFSSHPISCGWVLIWVIVIEAIFLVVKCLFKQGKVWSWVTVDGTIIMHWQTKEHTKLSNFNRYTLLKQWAEQLQLCFCHNMKPLPVNHTSVC